MVPMAASRKVSIAVAVAIGVIGISGRAHAQPMEAPPMLPVEIGGAEGVAFIQVQGPGGPVDCGTHCSVELPQGRYRLTVRDTDHHLSNQWLSVAQSRRFTVAPANRRARIGGIVLMGTGIAAAAAGGLVLWITFIGHTLADCEVNCSRDWPRGQLYGGAFARGAGAAVAITGLLIWLSNMHAVIDEAPPAPAARLRLTPIAGLRLAGLGLTGSF
jgi:hypothetical protein